MESCSLDREGLARQRERHRRVARDVRGMTTEAGRLTIDLAPGYDRVAMDEMLDVERGCCPFFSFEVHYEEGRVGVTVAEPRQRPALAVFAESLRP